MKKTTLTVCICLMLLAGCDSSKTEKWSIVSSPDGKFGYVSWSKEVVGGFETCNGARNERDYWKKWSDEYDSTPHKFEPVKPKEYPKGYWTKVDCDQTNKPPVRGETTHGTLGIYAVKPDWTDNTAEVILEWDGDTFAASRVVQLGPFPHSMKISRLSARTWSITNLMLETQCEPVVTNDGTNWQITFKEGK